MPDISKITLPSGTTYNIKDAEAREQIKGLTGGNAVVFIGVSSTALTDQGTETPKVDGVDKTPATGQLFFYGQEEFIWGADSKWHKLGDLGSLGDLAKKNTASATYKPKGTLDTINFNGESSDLTITATKNTSGNYKPEGTIEPPEFKGTNSTFSGTFKPDGAVSVSTLKTTPISVAVSAATSGTVTYTPDGECGKPTITVTKKTDGATENISIATSKNMVEALSAVKPGETSPTNNLTYYSVTDEILSLYQLGYSTAPSINTSTKAVKTGDAVYTANSTAPSFKGTGVRLVTGDINVPSEYSASFDGTSASVSVSGVPKGNVAQPVFTGTTVQLAGTTTAKGNVSQPKFNGTEETITVS